MYLFHHLDLVCSQKCDINNYYCHLLSDHIHGVVNHPSVTACPELQKHLRVKKESLQKKLNGLIPELDTARHSPLSLQSILSVEEDANVIK